MRHGSQRAKLHPHFWQLVASARYATSASAHQRPHRGSGGTVGVDELRTDRMKAGERVNVWINAEGSRTTKPRTDQDAATEAVVSGFGLWFATVGLAAAAWNVLRLRLNRRRYADWDRELDKLADNGGRTNHV